MKIFGLSIDVFTNILAFIATIFTGLGTLHVIPMSTDQTILSVISAIILFFTGKATPTSTAA